MFRSHRSVLLCVILVTGFLATVARAQTGTIFESFEEGFGAWSSMVVGGSGSLIQRSQEQALDGSWSIEMFDTGALDDGTLWMVREIQLPPGSWSVNLTYSVWNLHDAAEGTWDSIGFIGDFEPTTEADLLTPPAGANLGPINTAGWTPRFMGTGFNVNEPTTIWVAFGLNVIFETAQSHFFDAVTVNVIPPIGCNNDGICDPGETGCICPADCPPGVETNCTDGNDNDCDGLTDCADSDCAADPACVTTCNDDGTCNAGEDCNNCPGDCVAGSGASCGNNVCETADGEDCVSCPGDCNHKLGGKPSDRYCCGDGTAEFGVTCADPRCTAAGNTCSPVPAAASCCGDGFCEGSEDTVNCFIDCAECSVALDCDDADACTIDDCVAGTCSSTPLDCSDGDACTTDSCISGACFNDPISCDDGDTCTTDTCDPGTGCVNTFPACGLADGCCGPACDAASDPDCVVCGDPGDSCSVNADCCSNKCKGNGKCR